MCLPLARPVTTQKREVARQLVRLGEAAHGNMEAHCRNGRPAQRPRIQACARAYRDTDPARLLDTSDDYRLPSRDNPNFECLQIYR